MTDEKLTDSEIVKALECCTQGRDIKVCWNCPLYVDLQTARECCEKLNTNALDLINRLQAENEALINGQETLQEYIATQKAENEELKSAINSFRGYEDKIKADAYKECFKKLKAFMHNTFKNLDEYEFEYVTARDIKNLLKEMVGEKNGR